MSRCWIFIVGCAGAIACGCAQMPKASPAAQAANAPTTAPLDSKSLLTLDQIQPKIALGPGRPATQPASLDALVLYARARDEQANRRGFSAINLLQQALILDPNSYELNYILGRAYMTAAGMTEQALAAYEKAAQIEPDNLEIQTELGRTYQTRGDNDKAMEHFRLARLTEGYRNDDPLAAVVDYRLGVLLEPMGYDRAALQCYSSLVRRLEHASAAERANQDIAYLLSQPELVYTEIGTLQEKLGENDAALRTYQKIAELAPDDFENQARVIRSLVKLGHSSEAFAAAMELVRATRASPASLILLQDVHERSGDRRNFADALRSQYQKNPTDRGLLFAVAETLAGTGQVGQADQLMWNALHDSGGDIEIVQRYYRLFADRDLVPDAARMIVRISAAYPDTVAELQPMFEDLTHLWRKNSLRLPVLQELNVPAEAIPARQYWVWQIAREMRPATARVALEQSANASRVFAPACRELLESYHQRSDLDDAGKLRAENALIESVRSRGRPDLAAELSGIVAIQRNEIDEAARDLADAMRAADKSGPSPQLQLENALILLRKNDSPNFEAQMWKLIKTQPHFTDGYEVLYNYYKQAKAQAQQWNVLNAWLMADPDNVGARINLVDSLISADRAEEAITQMRRLFDDHPDDRDVVANMVALFNSAGLQAQVAQLLEAERTRHPGNRVAVEWLMSIYMQQGKAADAQHVVDAARTAVAGDPDLLYYISNLYQQINQPALAEQVLQDVLKLDPKHPQAGNDLGYEWTDAGKNLDRAEALIRNAVQAEPDNPSYLDSLGWVLYKRGKFDQALKYLQDACDPPDQADPIVLNHLGDALYRLGKPDQARKTWQQSMARIDQTQPRSDLITLRGQLQNKLKQADASQPVDVAPIVESPQNPGQAKN